MYWKIYSFTVKQAAVSEQLRFTCIGGMPRSILKQVCHRLLVHCKHASCLHYCEHVVCRFRSIWLNCMYTCATISETVDIWGFLWWMSYIEHTETHIYIYIYPIYRIYSETNKWKVNVNVCPRSVFGSVEGATIYWFGIHCFAKWRTILVGSPQEVRYWSKVICPISRAVDVSLKRCPWFMVRKKLFVLLGWTSRWINTNQ